MVKDGDDAAAPSLPAKGLHDAYSRMTWRVRRNYP